MKKIKLHWALLKLDLGIGHDELIDRSKFLLKFVHWFLMNTFSRFWAPKKNDYLMLKYLKGRLKRKYEASLCRRPCPPIGPGDDIPLCLTKTSRRILKDYYEARTEKFTAGERKLTAFLAQE